MKGRSGSIVIKQQEGKATAQKKVENNGEGGGFFSKMANIFCGTKPATEVNDPKREASAQLMPKDNNGQKAVRQSQDVEQIK